MDLAFSQTFYYSGGRWWMLLLLCCFKLVIFPNLSKASELKCTTYNYTLSYHFELLCNAFFAQYNIGRFFLPFSPEKKLSGKAILRRRRAILHRFYTECNKSFSCCIQLKKTRQKMHSTEYN